MKIREEYMRMAIREAAKNLNRMEGGPFGACIVKGSQVLAVSRNTVLSADATCHAEINAIRQASRKLRTYDLSGCVIYSTTEPCPMCFGAIHWARISCVVSGTDIQDAADQGFNELYISNRRMKTMGGSQVKLITHFLADECKELFNQWKLGRKRPSY